jgi:hypothetical protein
MEQLLKNAPEIKEKNVRKNRGFLQSIGGLA